MAYLVAEVVSESTKTTVARGRFPRGSLSGVTQEPPETSDPEEHGELRRALHLWGRPALAAAAAGIVTFFFVAVPHEKERLHLQAAALEMQVQAGEARARIRTLELERRCAFSTTKKLIPGW